MWFTRAQTSEIRLDVEHSAQDLLESITRRMVLLSAACYVLWFIFAGMTSPSLLGWPAWLITALVLGLGAAILQLLARNQRLALGIWQVGLALVITLVVVLFQRPEATLFYVLLPLVAVMASGWVAGALAEAVVIGLLLAISQNPDIGLAPMLMRMVAAAAALCGLIGWSFAGSLYTVAEWSLVSFREASTHMREAQNHRAELAQTLKALDHAYYRLERANAALVAARKAAEEADRFKSEFVANVSHELRTPLNLIIGFSEVMITSPESYGNAVLPRAYRSDLNAIYHSAQHLLGLVDDVLDLARIEAGKVALSREEVALVTLMAEATETVRDYIAKKRLDFRIDVASDLPPVLIDRLRIRQVLLNLLVNAARFTERGSITLIVEAEENAVRVSVRDTGQGIPPRDLPKVFEEFRSTEQPTSAWHSGTGLGLPISKKFVELHGGQMGVESVVGFGSTFWFTLPIVAPREATAMAQRRWSPLVALGAPERIVVVVHDDPRIGALLKRYLDDIQIVTVPTVEEGMALAEELQALALVLDSSQPLPHASGGTLIVQCPLPSGYQAAVALGATDYLVKPVSSNDLNDAIERLSFSPSRVLVVDDEPEVVRLFSRMLRARLPAECCLEAYSGEEALSLMRAEQPDLVLLDLMMPGLDGRSVLQQKAADPQIANIPVVIVSADSPDYAVLTLPGAIQVTRAEGLPHGDVMQALAVLCATLVPGWEQISAVPA